MGLKPPKVPTVSTYMLVPIPVIRYVLRSDGEMKTVPSKCDKNARK